MRFLSLGLVLVTTIVTIGCPRPHKKKHQSSPIVKIKGDPMAFVRGTSMRRESTIREEAVDLNAYYQVNVFGFSNEVDNERDNYDAKVKEQAPPDGSDASESEKALKASTFRFVKTGTSLYELVPVYTGVFKFSFEVRKGHLHLTQIGQANSDDHTRDFEVLHYSSTPNEETHSALILESDSQHKVLMDIAFSKMLPSPRPVQRTNLPYNYLAGKGVRVGWDQKQPLTVTFCSGAPTQYKWFQEGIADWAKALNGRLSIAEQQRSDCPPFSDVNVVSYNHISEWVEILDVYQFTAGQTHLITDYSRGVIRQARVFILDGEFQQIVSSQEPSLKVTDPRVLGHANFQQWFLRTAKHELGHVLGLHHVFDGTTSIMAYEQESTQLADYDVKAIQGLYPLVQ
ncbi:MAG: matrixin family metalloprotease [Bdellovibrionales bacterium]